MKKTIYLFGIVLILASLCFVSCSDDDPKYSIVGVWKRVNLHGYYVFRSDKTYDEYHSAPKWDRKEPDVSGTYTFDGKYLVLDSGFKKEVVFSEDGNEIEFDGKVFERLK